MLKEGIVTRAGIEKTGGKEKWRSVREKGRGNAKKIGEGHLRGSIGAGLDLVTDLIRPRIAENKRKDQDPGLHKKGLVLPRDHLGDHLPADPSNVIVVGKERGKEDHPLPKSLSLILNHHPGQRKKK